MPHKLLLADDSVTIQRVIELTFADEDVQVIAVGDGRQAIERLQSERPDIVLADIGMPERDGYEVASFIKGTPDLAHIPVLLLTGAFEPIDEVRARAVGCDGVLVKPFEPQMVISRVKEFLSGKRRSAVPEPGPVETPLSDAAAPVPDPPNVGDTRPSAAPPPAASAGAPQPSGSIEEYFDRLDAAFASLDTSPGKSSGASPLPLPAPPAGPAPAPIAAPVGRMPPSRLPAAGAAGGFGLADELASWDPDLSSDVPARPGDQEDTASAGAADPGMRSETPSSAPDDWAAQAAAAAWSSAPDTSTLVPEALTPAASASVPAPPVSTPAPSSSEPARSAWDPAPSASGPEALSSFGSAPAPSEAAPSSFAHAPSASDLAPSASAAAPSSSSSAAAPSSTAPAPSSSAPIPSLAEAFAALLAAEQEQSFAPARSAPATVTDDIVEQVTHRVIERLGSGAVRDVVAEVAERLVREEIARIKGHAELR